MKKLLFIALLLVIIIFFSFFLWYKISLKPVSSTTSSQTLIIPKGANATQIAQLLTENKLIRSPLAFRLYLRFHPDQSQLRAGSFKLSPNLSIPQIVNKLTKGGFEGVWVTILEGWRREQIAQELNKQLKPCGINNLTNTRYELGKQSLTPTPDSAGCFSVDEFLQATATKEGYLFPDTYLLPPTASATTVVKILTDTFNQKTTNYQLPITNYHLTFDQSLILASILEREAAREADLPIVAGILLKRLQNNWPLQTDATLQYAKVSNLLIANSYQLSAVSDWWPDPYAADKDLNSPYNTYKHTGLPPAPIANPGLATVRAVLNPTDTTYWYYLTDLKGNMHYATTLEEHNQNVENYLK